MSSTALTVTFIVVIVIAGSKLVRRSLVALATMAAIIGLFWLLAGGAPA